MFSGASFSSSAGGAGRQLPLANALTQWAAQRREEQTNEALIRVQNSAVTAQQQVGTAGLAETPKDTTGIYAQAWDAQRNAVFQQLSLTSAKRAVNKLAREHGDDPDEYARQFNEYMVGQIMPLREVDATAAFKLQTALDGLGAEQQAIIEDNVAARAREMQQAAAISGFQESLAESRDTVLQDGSEETLANELEIIEAELDGLHNAGSITTAAWLGQKQAARTDLTRDMYFGQFEQLLAAGDLAGIAGPGGLIDHARSGALFDDNDRGRALAAQLGADLARRTESKKGEVAGLMAAHKDVLSDAVNSFVRTGRKPDSPLVDRAIVTLLNSDNVNDRQTAQQALNAFELGDLASRSQLANREDLQDGIQQMGALVGRLPGTVLTAGENVLQARDREILEAQRSRDPQSVFNDAAAGEEAAGFDWWSDKRSDSAYVTGTPLDEVPVYSKAKAEATATQFVEALQRERPSEALDILTDYMPPDRVPTPQIAAIAMQHNVPELASAGTMLALGGEDLTRTLLALGSAGRGAQDTDRSDALAGINDADDEAIREIADTLSMGSSATARRIESDLRSAAIGLTLRKESNDSAEAGSAREIELADLLEPLKARDTLVNGQRVPRGFFSPAGLAEINEVLGPKAVEFFGEGANRAFSVETYLPVPGPDGSVLFRSEVEAGVLIGPDPEPGERRQPYILTTTPPTTEEQVRTGFDVEGNLLASRGTDLGSSVAQTLREIPFMAGATGADKDTLRTLFLAAQATPQKQVATDRNFAAGFAEANLDLLDAAEYDRVWEQLNPVTFSATGQGVPPPPVPDPWASPDGSVVAASLILSELEQQFDDPQQIMLAYAVGADKVSDAGDKWRDLISGNVAAFMGRVTTAATEAALKAGDEAELGGGGGR